MKPSLDQSGHLSQMKTSMPKKRLWFFLLVGILGTISTLIQARHYYHVRSGDAAIESSCKIGSMDCTAADLSQYADWIGRPVALLGTAWYLTLIATVLWVLLDTGVLFSALQFLMVWGSAGVLYSLVYLWILFTKIDVLCPYCLFSDLLVFSVFAALLTLQPKNLLKLWPLPKGMGRFLWPAGSALVLSLFLFPLFLSPSQISPGDKKKLISLTESAYPVAIPTQGLVTAVGPENAPITIVKFSDFQCPSCQRGAYTIHPILLKYSGKIRFVQRQFPLSTDCNRMVTSNHHAYACQAALANICASQQGKFIESYETLFKHQSELSDAKIVELMQSLGLDWSRYEACLKSESTKRLLQADIEEGIRLGIQSTPTFFLNGKSMEGAYPAAVWFELIDGILSR